MVQDAMAAAEALTINEAGGGIYQCGTEYAYSVPITQEKPTHVDIMVGEWPDGACKLVAFYHTHPEGEDYFSKEDIKAACHYMVPSYIRPRNGEMRVFDCRTVPEPLRVKAWQNPKLARGDAV